MFKNLGLQLFTIRDYMKDPEFTDLSLKKVRDLGYTEAQAAGTELDDRVFADLLKKNGIKVVGDHCSYDDIINHPDKLIERYRLWGTTNFGVGGIPQFARDSVEGVNRFVNEYNKAAELFAKEGFKLTFHNHDFEFERIDGYKTVMDVLAEGFDPNNISFVLDTCWVAAGGGDVRAWIEKLAGRIDILHLKDMTEIVRNGSRFPEIVLTEVGHGNLYWDGIMESAEKSGVKYYVVEQDSNWAGTPFESLRMSAEFLKKYRK